MKPSLPICHLSCTLTLQQNHFNLLLPTFLLNLVSELHFLLVASDLPDHKFGTLYQITSNLLPLSPRSDPDSKLTSLLQLVNNWPPSELSAPLIRRHSWFCASYKCFILHYIMIDVFELVLISLLILFSFSLTKKYFRFHLFLVFESIIVFVSFLYYCFFNIVLPMLLEDNSAHVIPSPYMINTTDYTTFNTIYLHHNHIT